ncbi:MAG: nuclear transport factor 2 family protein [Novosphingobium sp.]|nr:nuclear transport factor 2 family protein [Novosphingobium sp.]
MDLQELADREEIRALMAQYNIFGDRGKVDVLAGTFAEDGVIEFGGAKTQGRAAIAARLGGGDDKDGNGGKGGGLTVSRHHLSTSLVTIDGDTASARTYFMVHTDIGPDHHGVYVDRLVRTHEGWRFAHREVRIDWQAENTLFQPLHVRGRPPA